jgi:hypothetical protein
MIFLLQSTPNNSKKELSTIKAENGVINNVPVCPQGIEKYVLNEYKILGKYSLIKVCQRPVYKPHFMPVGAPQSITICMFSILLYFTAIKEVHCILFSLS